MSGTNRRTAANLWGLADQAIVSATSFVTIVLLARGLAPDAFGSFTVVYTVLLVANALQTALVTQPHNVLGSTQGARYATYTGSTMAVQAIFAGALGLALLGAAGVAAMAEASVIALLVVAAPAAIAWQLQEFARRVLYTEGRIGAAFVNDLIGYGGQLVLLGVLAGSGELTGPRALWALAASSAAGVLLAVWQLRGSMKVGLDSETVRANWAFGKWLAGGTFGFTLSSHLYVYLVAAILGASAVGLLKAAQTLLGPLNVLLLFLTNVLPTRFARAYAAGGEDLLGDRLTRAYGATLPVVAIYCVATSLFAGPLLRLAYGEKYAGAATVVLLFACYYFASYTAQLVGSALSAKRVTRPIFVGNFAGGVTGVFLGWAFVVAFGVEGAVLGMLASVAALNLIVWSAFTRGRRAGGTGAVPMEDGRTRPERDPSLS